MWFGLPTLIALGDIFSLLSLIFPCVIQSFSEIFLPTKHSSFVDSCFTHGFGAETSLHLTQNAPTVSHHNIVSLSTYGDIVRYWWGLLDSWKWYFSPTNHRVFCDTSSLYMSLIFLYVYLFYALFYFILLLLFFFFFCEEFGSACV